jgi:hypothetical protein
MRQGNETHRWREELLQSKWPHIIEDIAIRKILSQIPLSREI